MQTSKDFLSRKRVASMGSIEIPSDYLKLPEPDPTNIYNLNPSLPIYKYAEEIISAINSHQVIVIAGRTGCGKTTQVPQLIYRDAEIKKKDVKILITQPRRIAAVSIAKRLAYELHKNLGDLVGYHVGMNPFYNSEKSKIIIKTTGIFLEELVHEKSNMNNYTHLILDEVHERDINIDFVLVLVKHFLSENKNIKLVLMSATISTVLFANYFSKSSIETISTKEYEYEEENEKELAEGDDENGDNDEMPFQFEWYVPTTDKEGAPVPKTKAVEMSEDAAPVIEIKEHVHKVFEFYIHDIMKCIKTTYDKLNNYKDEKNGINPIGLESKFYIKDFVFSFDKRIPSIEENMYNVCLHLIECIHLKMVHPNDRNSSILVFLPGLGEILAFKTYLLDHFSFPDKIEILTLHSNISDEDQQKVFKDFNGKRKVILATNIAESSITIHDTSYVIDFCLIKELQYNCKTNHESLELKWASKANCLQRAGRAGRVSQGYVFRLVNENFFKNVLDEFPSPEILRIPLEKVILKIKVYNCGEPTLILGRAITPPKIKSIDSAIMNLKNCGALTVDDTLSPSGQLTELGKVYAELPIDIKYSRLIMLAYTFGLTEIGIVSAAILSQEKKIFRAYDNRRARLYNSKQEFSHGTECDVITSFIAFKSWESKFGSGLIRNEFDRKVKKKSMKTEDEWCRAKSLSTKILREVLILTSDIKKRLSYLGVYDSNKETKEEKVDLINNPSLINIFKYVLAGAFYGKMFKSCYVDIDKIKKFREMSLKSSVDYSNTIFVRGLPSNLKGENLKKFFSQFGEIDYFDYQSQEARIGFTKSTYKEAIKLILFLGSNLVFNNQELGIEYEDTLVYLRKPEYLYELTHYDIFSYSKVDIEPDSINHITIENQDTIIPLIVHICDNYYQRKTKYTARYVTRMPNKPMIDTLLILIFTPYAVFYANESKTQYKSFKLLGSSNVEFMFNYLFSSIDIREINSIRKILNRLVKTKDMHQIDFNLLRKQLIQNVNNLINKRRLKIISRESWNRLLYRFFPDITREKEKNYKYSEDININLLNVNGKEPNITSHKPQPEIKSSDNTSKISNDFLQPLLPLPIKEDFRLWTDEGLTKIEEERKLYNTMRDMLLDKISYRKSIINQKSPEIFCCQCNSFICSLNNIKRYPTSDRYVLSIWGKINEYDVSDENIKHDKFVLEYYNYISKDPTSFFTCFEGKHIIGFKINNEYFLTKYSSIKVKLPGDEFVLWDDNVFNESFQTVLDNALIKREEYIKKNLECELCNFRTKEEGKFMEHLRNKERMRAMRELQEEIF